MVGCLSQLSAGYPLIGLDVAMGRCLGNVVAASVERDVGDMMHIVIWQHRHFEQLALSTS